MVATMLASSSRDCSVCVWDMSGKLLRKLTHPKPVSGLAFSLDGSKIFSSCWDEKVYIWDTYTGQMVTSCKKNKKTNSNLTQTKYSQINSEST